MSWESFKHDFSNKITFQREHVDNTHRTMEALCKNLQKQGDVMELSGVASSSLLQEVHEEHSRTEQFIKRNIICPSNSGETPIRRKQVALPEPVEIPDASDLINKTNESEMPRRLSQYRIRPCDSILETPFTVLSPKALKEILNCYLDEIVETPEDSSEYGCTAVKKQNDSTCLKIYRLSSADEDKIYVLKKPISSPCDKLKVVITALSRRNQQ
uniref:Uncharacterized protein n=1 Tax=Wuchereria bancrofti TaxID=6293 RepID=A0A1I8EY23_WUCBA